MIKTNQGNKDKMPESIQLQKDRFFLLIYKNSLDDFTIQMFTFKREKLEIRILKENCMKTETLH